MTQDILFENEQNMLTQLRSLGSVLKDIPQFFVQVSNFDINC